MTARDRAHDRWHHRPAELSDPDRVTRPMGRPTLTGFDEMSEFLPDTVFPDRRDPHAEATARHRLILMLLAYGCAMWGLAIALLLRRIVSTFGL